MPALLTQLPNCWASSRDARDAWKESSWAAGRAAGEQEERERQTKWMEQRSLIISRHANLSQRRFDRNVRSWFEAATSKDRLRGIGWDKLIEKRDTPLLLIDFPNSECILIFPLFFPLSTSQMCTFNRRLACMLRHTTSNSPERPRHAKFPSCCGVHWLLCIAPDVCMYDMCGYRRPGPSPSLLVVPGRSASFAGRHT